MLMFLNNVTSSLLLDDPSLVNERTITIMARMLIKIKQGSDESDPFFKIKKVGTPFPE